MSLPRSFRAWVLIALLLPILPGQTPQPPGALPGGKLRVLILEGSNALNSIPSRAATFPVVEVRDENDLPVEGAEVIFTLPAAGPGGLFPNQKNTFTGRTNLQGQVRAPYLMNATPGDFSIEVSASIGSRTGKVVVLQTHVMRTPEELTVKKRRWYKDWRVWAIASGGAATAIILGTRGGDSSSTSTSVITITPGGPTLGGPR